MDEEEIMGVRDIESEVKIISPRIIFIDKVSLNDIKEYLKAKHCVLWQNWYVTDPKGLEDAAKWIQSLLIELYTGLSSKQG